VLDFGRYLIVKTAEHGEKYDANLVILADIALQVAEQFNTLDEKARGEFKTASEKLIEALSEKGDENMI